MNNTERGKFSLLSDFGFVVFPLKHRSKVPVQSWTKYQKQRPTAEDLALWDQGSYNVAIATGRPSGLCVIDVDSDEAQALIDSLDLPSTPIVKTARGRHYYFACPPFEVRNKVRLNGCALDVRGDGGYVVGPQSQHESGHTYVWEVSPEEVPLADIPGDLLALLSAPRAVSATTAKADSSGSTVSFGRFASWLDAHLRRARESISAVEGERNETLFRAAVSLANDVAAAGAEWSSYAAELLSVAIAHGLPEAEAKGTLDSAWKIGSATPTRWIRTAHEWVYVASRDQFLHLESGAALRPSGFNSQFNSEWFGKGNISNALTKNDLIVKVQDIDYDPRCPGGVYGKSGLNWLNTYKPSPIEAQAGDASQFEEFLRYLVPADDERDHLAKMIAWTVRHPGKKLGHALLLRSQRQGVGKSTLVEIWRNLLGEHNTRKTTTEEINGAYQGYLAGTLLVTVEELNMAFGQAGYNRLKDIITGTTAVVNEKYIVAREQRNFASFVFLTNLSTPMLIEDTDRRIFFIDSPAEPREAQYYSDFNKWWKENVGIIRHWVDSVSLDRFNPFAAPPKTAARNALIGASRSPVEQEIEEAIANRRGPFARDIVSIDEVRAHIGYLGQGKSLHAISSSLARMGGVHVGQHRVSGSFTWFDGRPAFIPDAGRRANLWIVRNAGYWSAVSPLLRAEEHCRSRALLDDIREDMRLPEDIGFGHLSRIHAYEEASCQGV